MESVSEAIDRAARGDTRDAQTARTDRFESRRTFAIISHPDAGKTTLTEKLLSTSGAIRLAGQVKARGQGRRARSDWMEIEQKRGISVTSSVMTFEHDGLTFNLLDTPGHSDFSEDTYRTLTAVDSAVMVIDAAKGIESQTLKLFEVCRLRDIPIITFVNKVDREGLDPLELLDEIANKLALDVTPVTWPVGHGRRLPRLPRPRQAAADPARRLAGTGRLGGHRAPDARATSTGPAATTRPRSESLEIAQRLAARPSTSTPFAAAT